jgi:hypothetical protein
MCCISLIGASKKPPCKRMDAKNCNTAGDENESGASRRTPNDDRFVREFAAGKDDYENWQ